MLSEVSSPTPFWENFACAWNAHDAASVAALFETDATFIFIDGRQFIGRSAIEQFYQETFSHMPKDWVHSRPTTETNGVVQHGSFSINGDAIQEPIMSVRYELELSSHGKIQRLVLHKI